MSCPAVSENSENSLWYATPLYAHTCHTVLQPGKVERHSQSFWREAEMLSNLNHPNVLRFYGVVVESYAEPNVIGIMTEYMKGGSLAAALR